jgi:hypothetical protein
MMVRRGWMILWLGLALGACGGSEPRVQEMASEGEGRHAAGHGEHAAVDESGPRPTRVLEDGSRLFGAELSADRPVTPLAQIAAAPASFAGQVVKTEGTIERVCQAMGCWMELRAEGTPAVRVPMAGHAFFLPRDVGGRSAVIEGRVAVQRLSPEAREHLAAEGAQAVDSELSIEATGVIVR